MTKYTGTKLDYADLSSDQLKHVFQNAQPTATEFANFALTDRNGIKASRVNDANAQGGTPKEPNTQPGVNYDAFNRANVTYTPDAKMNAFMAEANAWAKANLHTGGKK